ncbi:2-polyprenyl-6-methoxyphenol hydroxylase-like FAD-dependent oxidoreductase [Actinocorallia herbida]|uniref:2-polyprenyl-6-methoxyphenol hydroxylase-like FAD-dependent oxidoreductase n=1 Tax=Actinocorallia herbida TaxID=58109 RepID=A0A3N1D103_9ACTN|nr:FAD-dependent monooxygenase [Actinocorallia herbida]ROO87191.1 2-polyprenyl-6-methoxyphenol hydroxylase-like FAD-dependent oxidoreductase [Actinocorallia herbida]
MSRGSVLIVGGGIGGLSTAIALRNVGYEVNVVEIQEDLHSSVFGVGIIQPMNALRALDAIGCALPCMEAGYPAPAWGKVVDVEGNFLRDMPGARVEGSDLPPLNGITRPQLHRILTDKAAEVGVTIEYSKTFTELVDGPDGVAVTYDDGTENTVDHVVGADGVYSKVRPYVLGEMKPTFLGQGAYRVNVPRLPEIDRIILQTGPNGMAGFVPIGQDLAYFFYNTDFTEGTWLESSELGDLLREHLEGFGGLTGWVRDNFCDDASQVVFRPEEWLIAPAPWHRGRIVLIGDAVHAVTPHLGQGAAQAIEDGIVLAECLAAGQGDHEKAFAAYTERRYERCKLVVETCVNIGKWEMDPSSMAGFDHVAATEHVLREMVKPI